MDDLKLPIEKNPVNRPLVRNRNMKMEDIINFMQFNMDRMVDIKAVRKNKRKLGVDLPFQL